MFGYWYIVFGFLALLIISIVVFLICSKCEIKHEKLYEAKEFEYYSKTEISKDDKNKLKSEARKHLDKSCHFESAKNVFGVILGGSAFFVVLFIILSLGLSIVSKEEVIRFECERECIEQAIESGSELDNIAVTQTIIESNRWLAKAKASIKMYGCFSEYWGQGIENLKPITINKGD